MGARETMPRYGHALTLGFSEDVQGALVKERTSLKEAGVDPDVVLARIETLHAKAASLNAHQESLKRELKATTEEYVATLRKLYITCSGALDMAMASVEKSSPAAKNLQRLRSRIRRDRPSPAAPPPPSTSPRP
jgi:hypothetical protein